MKSGSGPSGSWLRSISQERRTALLSLMFLIALLGTLLAYQRLSARLPLDAADAPHTQSAADASTRPEQSGLAPRTEAAAAQGVASLPGTAMPTEPVPVIRPLPGQRKVLRPYGFAVSKEYGDFRHDPGIDYQAALGESVLAAAPGRVVAIDDDPADGKVITLDHGNGMTTRYASLGQIVVGVDAAVRTGDVLATIGQPAPARSSIGTHLHFEVLLKGEPVDPATYLSK